MPFTGCTGKRCRRNKRSSRAGLLAANNSVLINGPPMCRQMRRSFIPQRAANNIIGPSFGSSFDLLVRFDRIYLVSGLAISSKYAGVPSTRTRVG